MDTNGQQSGKTKLVSIRHFFLVFTLHQSLTLITQLCYLLGIYLNIDADDISGLPDEHILSAIM